VLSVVIALGMALYSPPATAAAGDFPGPVSFELNDEALSALAMPFDVAGTDFIVGGSADGSVSMFRFIESNNRFTLEGRLQVGGRVDGLIRWEGRPVSDQGIVAITSNPDRLHFLAASPTNPTLTALSFLDLPEDPGSVVFVGDPGVGHRELAVSLPGLDRIHLYILDGDDWRLDQVLEAGDRPEFLVGMDLDGDQVRELISANNGPLSGNFGVYRRDPDGAYRLKTHPFAPGSPGDIAAFDLDGDGNEELFATVDGQPQVMMLDDLAGELVVIEEIGLDLPGERLILDRLFDGSTALFITNAERGLVDFLQRTGSAWTRRATYFPGCQPTGIISAELNGDGGRDLICVGRDAHVFTGMLANTRPGFWGLPALTLSGVPGPSAVGDFDGDGLDDLVVVMADQPLVSIFPGLPGGGHPTLSADTPLAFFPGQAVALNADPDEALELAVLDPAAGQMSLLDYRVGTGFVEISRTPVGVWPFFVTSKDLDGDGVDDLLVLVRETSEVRAIFGAGDGTFDEVVAIGFGGVADRLTALDLNADGWLDVVASDGNNRIWIQLNQDSRSFGDLEWLNAGSGVMDMAVGDLDGDLDEDLVTVNSIDLSLSFFENDSQGGLVRRIGSHALGTAPTDIAIGDIDQDGEREVILSLPDESRVAGVFPLGLWQYSSLVELGRLPNPSGFSITDINQDGVPDILALDQSLQLGLEMLNVEQILVAAEPVALSAACAGGRVEIRVRPGGDSPWLLEAGDGLTWRTLAADGSSVAGDLGYDRGVWIVTADPADLTWRDGNSLTLRLAVGGGGRVAVTEQDVTLPCLEAAQVGPALVIWEKEPWPNPFNPLVHARFNLARSSRVTVGIYDVKGRLVENLVTGELAAGGHAVSWNGAAAGRSVGAGVYFMRIDTPDLVLTRKVMLLK